MFLKFTRTLNYISSNCYSFKGKSSVINSLTFSKFIYFMTEAIIPEHYLMLFQGTSFEFI
jgi:hypothetical protein